MDMANPHHEAYEWPVSFVVEMTAETGDGDDIDNVTYDKVALTGTYEVVVSFVGEMTA